MTDDNPSKQFHLDKPDELLDEILDRLLQFDEQWPPAEETDQDRIEGVSAILHRGIEAAKIGLGIVSAVHSKLACQIATRPAVSASRARMSASAE